MSFVTLLEEQKALQRILGPNRPQERQEVRNDALVSRLLGEQAETRARAQAPPRARTSNFQKALSKLKEERSRYEGVSRGALIKENKQLRRTIHEKDRTIQALRQAPSWDRALNNQRMLPEDMDNRPPRRRFREAAPTRAPEPPPRGPRTDRELIEQIRQADASSPARPRLGNGPAAPPSDGPLPLVGPTPGDLGDRPSRWETLDCDPFGAPLPASEPLGNPRFEALEMHGEQPLEPPPPAAPEASARFEDIGGSIAALIDSATPMDEGNS